MATYQDGTLVKASGPEVDRMEGGQRRWIPDTTTFTCMGLNWGAIQTIADSEWNQIPKGVPYPSRADGTLLQGSGPQVYVMTGCQRHWIPDPETFNAHGYHWSAVQHISDADLTAIPDGVALPPVKADSTAIAQAGAQEAAAQSFIMVYNNSSLIANCTIEYVLNGQHQSQSNGALSAKQGYSVPIPNAATNIHVTCDAEGEMVLDQTYSAAPLIKVFTLNDTTNGPACTEQTDLENPMNWSSTPPPGVPLPGVPGLE